MSSGVASQDSVLSIVRKEMKSACIMLSSRELNRARRKAKLIARQKSIDVSDHVSSVLLMISVCSLYNNLLDLLYLQLAEFWPLYFTLYFLVVDRKADHVITCTHFIFIMFLF